MKVDAVLKDSAGSITTFYSYKGGTGRSMAVANCGLILARQPGARVLMIDWDLEAPGLHYFFDKDGSSGTSWTAPVDGGLLELFEMLDSLAEQKAQGDAAVAAAIETLDLDRHATPVWRASLYLMPSGRFDDSYSSRVMSFDWERLFERAPKAFELLAQRLIKDFTHVLIDSRTGLSAIGGVYSKVGRCVHHSQTDAAIQRLCHGRIRKRSSS